MFGCVWQPLINEHDDDDDHDSSPLKSQALSPDALHRYTLYLCHCIVSVSWQCRQLSTGDKPRIDSLFQKALYSGEHFVAKLLVRLLTSSYQIKIFCQMSDMRHCRHVLLPKQRHNKIPNSLRSRKHNYVAYYHILNCLCSKKQFS